MVNLPYLWLHILYLYWGVFRSLRGVPHSRSSLWVCHWCLPITIDRVILPRLAAQINPFLVLISLYNPEKANENFLGLSMAVQGGKSFFNGDAKQKKRTHVCWWLTFSSMERPCLRIKPAFKSITVTLKLWTSRTRCSPSLTPPSYYRQ